MEAPKRTVHTLVLVLKEDQILLGFKKHGFGMGKWNGFGGEVNPDENILDAAARKLKEDCCLIVKPEELRNVAHLELTFDRQPKTMMEIHVFSAYTFEGTPTETAETKPKWFKKVSLRYEDMWLDSKHWVPFVLRGRRLYGRFAYEGYDRIDCYAVEMHETMEKFYAARNRNNK